MVSDVSLMLSTRDASLYLFVLCVVGCDRLVVGVTMAALSNGAESLGAMHIGRLLMKRGMLSLASTSLKVCYVDLISRYVHFSWAFLIIRVFSIP